MVTEGFAGMHVRQMDFDEGDVHAGEGVAQATLVWV